MENRIRKLIAHYSLSDRAFAHKCGILQQTLSHQLNGTRSVSLATVQAICNAYPEVNRAWLLMGEGEMFGGADKCKLSDNFIDADCYSDFDNNNELHDALRIFKELAAQQQLISISASKILSLISNFAKEYNSCGVNK